MDTSCFEKKSVEELPEAALAEALEDALEDGAAEKCSDTIPCPPPFIPLPSEPFPF